jgi:hypothetical protein
LLSLNHRVGTIRGVTNNRKVGLSAKERADCFAWNRVVVNDDDVCALRRVRVSLRCQAFARIDLVEQPQDIGSLRSHPDVLCPHPTSKILIFTKEEQ